MRVGIFGAGAVGCYLGVRLSAAGVPVTLIGRRALIDAKDELVAISMAGERVEPAADLVVSDDPAEVAGVDLCLVTVKSAATDEAGRALSVLRGDATVVSVQNGLGNAARLRAQGLRNVLSGMITFNVVREGPATFRRGTSGPLLIDAALPAELAASLPSVSLELRPDMEAVLATKLLLNLNNGLCAVTGLPIKASLERRELRRCFAACIREGLRAYAAAGIGITRIGTLSPPLIARLLGVPNWLFARLAGGFMKIDPKAKSSTLQDIEAGKPTEIDYLNGHIARLADENGVAAPANAFITDTVHRLEGAGGDPAFLSAEDVFAAIHASAGGLRKS